MCGYIELPILCDENRIPGMLSDIWLQTIKKYFFPARTQYNFFSRGVNCGSGGRGQTNIILLSALSMECFFRHFFMLFSSRELRSIPGQLVPKNIVPNHFVRHDFTLLFSLAILKPSTLRNGLVRISASKNILRNYIQQ